MNEKYKSFWVRKLQEGESLAAAARWLSLKANEAERPRPYPHPSPGSNAICSSTLVLAHMDTCTAAHGPRAGLGATSRERPEDLLPSDGSLISQHLKLSIWRGAELREHSATDCPVQLLPTVAY